MFVDQGIGTDPRPAAASLNQGTSMPPSGSMSSAACSHLRCDHCPLPVRSRGSSTRRSCDRCRNGLPLSLVINATAAVHHTLFFRDMDFRRPAIRALIGNLIGGIVGVVMAFRGWDVWSLIGQQLAGAFAGAVFLWTASTWRPNLSFSLRHLRELMAMSVSRYFRLAFSGSPPAGWIRLSSVDFSVPIRSGSMWLRVS